MQKLLLIGVCLVALFLQGCARNIFVLPVQENIAGVKRFQQQTVSEYNKDNYPLTIENINSRIENEELVYKRPPQRVIAVWQNSIETLLALGVGDRIIAGNGVPDKKYFLPQYQEEYSKIPYTGIQLLDLETTMMLKPDFIIGWYSTFSPKVLRETEFWHKRGVNTYISANSVPNKRYKTLQNEYDDILKLGKIFDKQQRAEEIVGNMQAEINFVKEKTSHIQQKPRALVVEFLGKDVGVYNEKSLAGNIINELHGELLAPKDLNIGIEQIINYDPDVIFVIVIEAYYGMEEEMVKRITEHNALKNLRCVKNGRVIPLPLYNVYSSGIRTYDGIKAISRGLYPELYKEQK